MGFLMVVESEAGLRKWANLWVGLWCFGDTISSCLSSMTLSSAIVTGRLLSVFLRRKKGSKVVINEFTIGQLA